MPGTRKYNPVDEDTTKVTIIVPKDIDRQLRMLAARQGSPVGPMIREWIAEKLKAAERTYRSDQGDLTIAWDEAKHAEMVEHIQALMEKGVAFHRVETKGTGRIRKKVVGQPIRSTDEITDRRLLITDASIAKLAGS
jgi:hypothetical protein